MLLKNIKSLYLDALKELYSRQETGNLFNHVAEEILSYSKNDVHRNHSKDIPSETEEKMLEVLERLVNGEPIQYIFGYTNFYDLTIQVNPSVLIPRPETEYLVHLVLNKCKEYSPETLIDLCTGSGCIAVALATHLEKTAISATDVSSRALEMAKKNTLEAGVEIRFFQDDLLHPQNTYQQYDCIISNPPYVRISEKAWMHRNVLDFEPHTALFVEDKNPLLFYKAIAEFGQQHLNPGGSVWCEINENLGSETAALFKRRGYQQIKVLKDLNNKDRFISAKSER